MGARRGTDKTFSLYYSDIVTVDTTIELTGLDMTKAHCFAAVQFFDDAAGDIAGTATAGSVTVTAGTINNDPTYEPTIAGNIEAALPCTISWAANTIKAKAVPAGVTGASYYRMVVTCNET